MAGQREQARRAVMADITAEGRRQLARDGAAGLSVRAIARELDMASSAIYRYVASRDELLTLLIVAGYDRLGAALEAAGAELTGRAQWRERGRVLRAWAHANPEEYALLYGSPVPGYAAPQDTIDPATRVYTALAEPAEASTSDPPPSEDGQAVVDGLGLDVPSGLGLVLVQACAALFGMVSFELFGHTNNVVTDHEGLFDHHLDALADTLGLP
jgi:AcrR family transcriptional regulator